MNPSRRRKRLTARKDRIQPAPGSGRPTSHGSNPRSKQKQRMGWQKEYGETHPRDWPIV